MENELSTRVIEQTFHFWINPEIEKRRTDGSLPDHFNLFAAQVIFNVEAPAEVRLNKEVRAVFRAHTTKPIEKGNEVWVSDSDIDRIESIELTDLDPNAGHLTMIFIRDRWYVSFDFRYNASHISEHLKATREFLDSSAFCLESGNLRAFVENLFSAVELVAKSELLMRPDKTVLHGAKHTFISNRFNLWGKLGNVDPHYVTLLKRLTQLRGPARYFRSDLMLEEDEARNMLAIAEEMLTRLHAIAPRRVSLGDFT